VSKHAPTYPNAATDPFNQVPGMNRPPMATDVEQKAARPHDELIRELLDSRIPKSEREHAAAREIERLRENVDRLTAYTIEHRGSTISCSDAMFDAYSDERRHAANLVEALQNLAMCVNTVYYCYCRRPSNLPSALVALRESAEKAWVLMNE
jgi:hypothetical protein